MFTSKVYNIRHVIYSCLAAKNMAADECQWKLYHGICRQFFRQQPNIIVCAHILICLGIETTFLFAVRERRKAYERHREKEKERLCEMKLNLNVGVSYFWSFHLKYSVTMLETINNYQFCCFLRAIFANWNLIALLDSCVHAIVNSSTFVEQVNERVKLQKMKAKR